MKREVLKPITKTLFSEQQEPVIIFRDIRNNHQIIGEFRIINGLLNFEGSVDKSAEVFINYLIQTFNSYTEEEVLNILVGCEWITKKAKIKWFKENYKK
jgi:hypothetical protein